MTTTAHELAVPGTASDSQLVIQRVFDFPRDVVFEAWTDRALLTRWFAPSGCTLHIERLDVREGGGFHWRVTNPSFGDCWTVGTYTEVVRPERIVFTSRIADAAGVPATSISQGHDPDWPAETVIRVTFAEQGAQTLVTLEQNVSEALAKRTGAYPSWLEMLDGLDRQLAGVRS